MKQAAYWTLIWQLLKRDLQERYAGTLLGVIWIIMQPLLLVAVYTLVFSQILQVRFAAHGNALDFTLYVLAGLALFNALSEVFIRAPTVLVDKRDWLLHSPIPASVLPLIPVLSSLITELVMVGLLWLLSLLTGQFHWQSVIFYPCVLVLRLGLSLSAAYALAILGVFIRDLRQLMPPMLTVLMLLSPVVYPFDMVPTSLRIWYELNPLVALIDCYRSSLLQGVWVGQIYIGLTIGIGLSGIAAYALFQRLMPRARYVL